MVTEIDPGVLHGWPPRPAVLETRPVTLSELGEMVGVPIKVRPWWGSLREPDPIFHRACDHQVRLERDRNWEWVPVCTKCRCQVGVNDVYTKRGSRAFVCPAGLNYNQIRDPEIQKGTVVIWEGRCHHPRHKHSQNVEVLSVAQGAILLKLSMGTIGMATRRFLVGVDDNHPYVTQVNKNPNTVQEAFDWLTPVMVKRARAAGLQVPRQGDWHFIPTDKEPRKDLVNDTFSFRSRVTGRYSNIFRTHFLYKNMQLIYGDETRHRGQYVCYQTVFGLAHTAPLVKGKVTAPNHPPIFLPGWHIGVRNRSTTGGAIRGGD